MEARDYSQFIAAKNIKVKFYNRCLGEKEIKSMWDRFSLFHSKRTKAKFQRGQK